MFYIDLELELKTYYGRVKRSKQLLGLIIKKLIISWKWHFKKLLTNAYGCPVEWLLRVCVSKRHLDALLAKIMQIAIQDDPNQKKSTVC